MEFLNENNWEHLSGNGTTFTHDRCDFVGGPIKAHKPWGMDQHSFWQDIAEMFGWHGVNIHPRLNGFAGYDCVGFEIIEEPDPEADE